MWSAISSIILGAIGWAGARLLFEPIKEIVDLRREAQECLIVFGNLSKDAAPDDRLQAAGTFRRIGAGLVSRHIAAWPWVAWFYHRCLHWDIYSAGTMLIGIGSSTLNEGLSHANASATVPLIRNCLQLPVLGEPTMIREMMDHAAWPAPLEPRNHF
ncbi:hypothetical protein ABID58_007438 [Bradyrhizobium sp. S3.2.6]|uniref:hypothetical protein n=1 Tax=Bradyrhizobium sp. S3.2.6 TaxID=3156428 RepID=UPI0033944C50